MPEPSYTPARLWRPNPVQGGQPDAVNCVLCAQFCKIAPGEAGKCGVRKNVGGELFTRSATELAAVNLDPVEKKPLYHFLPGSLTFSVGSFGCNFTCDFCQNHGISQYSASWEHGGHAALPAQIVEQAKKYRARSISYTYNEPTVFFEMMQPAARLAHEAGLRNIMVSNAYMSSEAFQEMDGLIDAANFDLKSFSGSFYQNYCGARLKPVLQTLERASRAGWWIELTTLLIGGLNDSREELDALAGYIRDHLGRQVPWHVSRFHPAYRMQDRPVTGLESIAAALEAGYKAGLQFVYAGNVPGHDSESTYCPACQAKALPRTGYRVSSGFEGDCPACGAELAGIWN